MYVERDNKEDTAGRSRGTEKKNQERLGEKNWDWRCMGVKKEGCSEGSGDMQALLLRVSTRPKLWRGGVDPAA